MRRDNRLGSMTWIEISYSALDSKRPLLCRFLAPAEMSAILSLWDGKRTLRKPYSTISIYGGGLVRREHYRAPMVVDRAQTRPRFEKLWAMS